MIKVKKAGFWTKFIVLFLIAYSLISLWNLKHSIDSIKAEVQSLEQDVDAQIQYNTELQDAIENSNDLEHRKDISRQRLGLLEPSEKIFYIVD